MQAIISKRAASGARRYRDLPRLSRQGRELPGFSRAPVAQMDRAADFESVGRVFEPPQARHLLVK